MSDVQWCEHGYEAGSPRCDKCEIERLRAEHDWQPIKTAPKDGTRILAYGTLGLEAEQSIGTVKWNDTYSRWQCDPSEASEYDPEDCIVTHWMPLPEPPK